jgi:copper chaperone
MTTTIYVDNIKCDGCTNSITHNIKKNNWVKDVFVDIMDGSILITSEDEGILDKIEEIKESLASIGYPEKGSGPKDRKPKANPSDIDRVIAVKE